MLVDSEDLETLAETCLSTARTIKSFLASHGHQPMSFDENGPAKFPPLPADIHLARTTLQEASHRLHALASDPEEPLATGLYYQIHSINAQRYVSRYGIAQAVPLNTTISYEELASKQKLDVGQLKQMLRTLMFNHCFCEPQLNHVAHTAASKRLLDPLCNAMNSFLANETTDYVSKQIDAIEKWGHGCQEPNKTALNFYYNTDKIMYQYYEEHPDVRNRFMNLMGYTAQLPILSREHIAVGFEWTSLGTATVVDVAGNIGQSSINIARCNPNLKIVVQDLPQIVKAAEDPSTSVIPNDLKHQFSFMAHDFFQPQTFQADVYFFRMVMHLFSDELCALILRNTMAAMKPQSRIVIMDQVQPPVGAAPRHIEEFMRAQNLQMLTLTNAKERDEEQWVQLLEKTDKRLKIKNIVTPPNSVMSLIEIVIQDAPMNGV